MPDLPPYATQELITERLPLIFPEGLQNRGYITRDMAVSTIFTFIYIGAIEGSSVYLGPVHVYRMTEEQAARTEALERTAYALNVLKKNFEVVGKRWYADNTREPLRDETLKDGLIQIGVVSSLNLPTTSSRPRYALMQSFAALFDPDLTGEAFTKAVAEWQEEHLSKSAQTRIRLARHSSAGSEGKVLITLPTGESRMVSTGPSSDISKAVIEVFAITFLEAPAVLWLSTSDDKVVQKDDQLAKEIGLNIMADRLLPDIILVDLAPKEPLLVFIEVVATDGPVNERRMNAIHEITDVAGFKRAQVTFVTAYMDRNSTGFKKTVSNLAWNSFAWFVSEPDKIVYMKDGTSSLSKLIALS